MRNSEYAFVRYCPQLQKNVIMKGSTVPGCGLRLECLNRGDCGYHEKGCRNMLLPEGSMKPEPRVEAV